MGWQTALESLTLPAQDDDGGRAHGGGLATSFLMELLVYPAIYLLWKWHTEVKSATILER